MGFLSTLSSAFNVKGIAIAAGLGLTVGFASGFALEYKISKTGILQLKLEAANLQIESLKKDAQAAAALAARANKNAADIAASAAANEALAHGLETTLSTLPADSVCRLSDDDVNRLRNIK